MAQVCTMSGAGLYNGWCKLDFIIQAGANRKRICPKHGAGMYNIFKPAPRVFAWGHHRCLRGGNTGAGAIYAPRRPNQGKRTDVLDLV